MPSAPVILNNLIAVAPPPPVPFPVELLSLPFTQLCDIVGNSRYPRSYRLNAAVQALQIANRAKQSWKNFPPGGFTLTPQTSWSAAAGPYDALITQYSREIPDFAFFFALAQTLI